ncbi:N-acetylmuramic acid 6-phosphate etherase [Curtobacterium sp. SORGH_AS_0776]|uniref:N-acetylmuramic acid 6-phosphate etherase n=1 Tax=Curtobacterium sp. SORGH_AS_0776 TaxID=3041798 RepID=UPI0028577A8F|nr:N-acetylmuramic acid 6-phosphate etherase [Curtobacterium sp. SORGH_AS_0776]MDR6171159.1 N-acetylmuramic acid 6-phosphate etherase [Curtobacterium sp. SORGH_AS_0776]
MHHHDDLREELQHLATEATDSSLDDIDLVSTLEAAQRMNALDRSVPAALEPCLPAIALAADSIAAAFSRGGRLIYVGAGTPGRLGVLDASECPPTFGTDPAQVVGVIAGGSVALTTAVEGAEDDEAAAVRDLDALGLTADDVVVGISASGRTPYVIAAILEARRRSALSVSVACNPDSAAGREADIAIDVVVGPEFIAGSTRLKAGTAQKLVLNMLTTLAMVRSNKTYGNRMVDVRATNEKLIARSFSLVQDVTGAASSDVAAALDAADGEVKTAIAMILTGSSASVVRSRLAAADGSLRAVLS